MVRVTGVSLFVVNECVAQLECRLDAICEQRSPTRQAQTISMKDAEVCISNRLKQLDSPCKTQLRRETGEAAEFLDRMTERLLLRRRPTLRVVRVRLEEAPIQT